MNERRKDIVRQAFRVLDITGKGSITAEDVKDRYNVDSHPDFISGKKTRFECLNELLQVFEVDSVDGKVTEDEFMNYYHNISTCIDDDDYFELMIRNAWHISGGEGAAANTANTRVLVTKEDGTQEVVEVKNDLGLQRGDTAETARRLKGQGYGNSSQISFGDSTQSPPPSPPTRRVGSAAKLLQMEKLAAETAQGIDLPPPVSPKKQLEAAGKKLSVFGSNIGGLLAGNQSSGMAPPPPPVSTQIFSGNAVISASGANVNASAEMPYGVSMLMKRMKEQLKNHGCHGFHGIQRKFHIMDDDEDGKLSLGEFKKGLKELTLDFTDGEVRQMFSHFDYDHFGFITFEHFLQSLKDDMSAKRIALVKLAFDRLDKDGDGALDPSELMEKYDASMHPDVVSGKKTETQALREWMTVFEVGGVLDGKVTYEEFMNYYHNLSASIENDDYFELMIRNAWHISGGEGWAANTTNRRVLVTRDDESQVVQEIEDDLGIKASDTDQMMAKIKVKDAHAASINLFGGTNDVSEPSKPMPKRGLAGRRYVQPVVNAYQASLSGTANAAVLAGVDPPPAPFASSPEVSPKKKPQSLGAVAQLQGRAVSKIIAEIKSEMAARGARGIVGLSRKFKVIDDNGDGVLSRAEFRKALNECNISLSSEEFTAVFAEFDKDGNGFIDFEEFLTTIRGPLPEQRLGIVMVAFNMLDTDGDGILEPDEMMEKYDTSNHPDVMSGKKTKTAVLREFLETFEVGGEVDGKVTKEEFLNYYGNLSASIDDDEYFELMVRNSWRISGGKGAAANTANTRVLVTADDGSQSVQEVKNDLGLKRGDTAETTRRLKAQGVNVSSISFNDGGDDSVGRKADPAARAPRNSKSVASSADNPLAGNFDPTPMPTRRKQQHFSHNAAGSSITF